MSELVLCGARTRAGGTCKKTAGWGTSHPGSGNCKLHGGSTPSGETHAAREVGAMLARNLGGAIEVDPLDALLQALYASAGATAWYRQKIEDLESKELHATVGGTEHGDGREEPHVWIRMYADERDRMARTAKLCLDAGVQERQVQVAEHFGEAIATLMAAVLEGLDLSPAQAKKAPDVVRRAMGQLELVDAAA